MGYMAHIRTEYNSSDDTCRKPVLMIIRWCSFYYSICARRAVYEEQKGEDERDRGRSQHRGVAEAVRAMRVYVSSYM